MGLDWLNISTGGVDQDQRVNLFHKHSAAVDQSTNGLGDTRVVYIVVVEGK